MSFIERYFRKNPHSTDEKDKINESDIEEFIDRKIEESVNLDYKHIDKYADKIGLGKVISSFANTDGGLLILGISEKKHLPQKPPTWGDSDKFSRETLEARLFSVIKPEIKGLYIHPVRHSTTSKVIFLIDVPKTTIDRICLTICFMLEEISAVIRLVLIGSKVYSLKHIYIRKT